MILKNILFAALALIPVLSMAQQSDPGTQDSVREMVRETALPSGVQSTSEKIKDLTDKLNTLSGRKGGIDQFESPEAMLSMLPAINGVSDIFNAYIDAGYPPLFSYILTSYDIIDAIRQISPEVADDEELRAKVNQIMEIYEAEI